MIHERKIPLTGADDRAQLQRIADEAVAREQPDFSADDQRITDAVAATFGSLTTQQMADTVPCIAEFAERVYAQKHGTIPPDDPAGRGRRATRFRPRWGLSRPASVRVARAPEEGFIAWSQTGLDYDEPLTCEHLPQA